MKFAPDARRGSKTPGKGVRVQNSQKAAQCARDGKTAGVASMRVSPSVASDPRIPNGASPGERGQRHENPSTPRSERQAPEPERASENAGPRCAKVPWGMSSLQYVQAWDLRGLTKSHMAKMTSKEEPRRAFRNPAGRRRRLQHSLAHPATSTDSSRVPSLS